MIRTSWAPTAALVLAVSSPAGAAAPRHALDLPAGRLQHIVVVLSRQTGSTIGIAGHEIAAMRVPAIRGVMSADDALRRLVAGRAVQVVVIDASTFRLVPAPRPRNAAKPDPGIRRLERPPDATVTAEIIVVGSKRSTALSSFGGPVQLLAGDTSWLDGPLRGTEALTSRLAVLTSTYLGPGRNKLSLRGLADSGFNGAAQSTVGQYLGEARVTVNGPDPNLRLYDMDRIEVMPGPQATLYGAGSLGGIVKAVPNPPSAGGLASRFLLGAEQTAHGAPSADVAAMTNVPLAADTALRLVGYATAEGGYIDDIRRGRDDVNATRVIGGRAALRSHIADEWTVDLGLMGQVITGDDAQYTVRGLPPRSRASFVRQGFGSKYLLASITGAGTLGGGRLVATLNSVRQTSRDRFDATIPQVSPFEPEDARILDQSNRTTMLAGEARITDGSLTTGSWVAGVAFSSNRTRQQYRAGPPGATARLPSIANELFDLAAFGEYSRAVGAGLNATIGGRLSFSRLRGQAFDVAGRDASLASLTDARELRFLPSAAITRELNGRGLLFVRYQTGYRPGGYAFYGDAVQPFRRDRLWAIEGGVRWRGFDALPFSGAASLSYTRWRDVQADVIGFDGLSTTRNIGDARIMTLDLSAVWRPAKVLSVEARAVLNNSQLTDGSSGIEFVGKSRLPNVAKANARAGFAYRRPIGTDLLLGFTGNARYVGKSLLGTGFRLAQDQGGWLDLGLAGRIETSGHTYTFSVTNLLDSSRSRFALGSPPTAANSRVSTPLRPRTIRLAVETRW